MRETLLLLLIVSLLTSLSVRSALGASGGGAPSGALDEGLASLVRLALGDEDQARSARVRLRASPAPSDRPW